MNVKTNRSDAHTPVSTPMGQLIAPVQSVTSWAETTKCVKVSSADKKDPNIYIYIWFTRSAFLYLNEKGNEILHRDHEPQNED